MVRRRAPRRRVPRRLASKPKATKALVKAVAKKVVADAMEDKYARREIPNVQPGLPLYFNAAISSTAEVYGLLPPIPQGTNSSNRVGDKIRPKSLVVNFYLTANGSYNSSQLNLIRCFVLQDKSLRNNDLLNFIPGIQQGTPISTQLLDIGGSTQGFSGVPSDIQKRCNRQRYTVFSDRVFEVCAGTGQTPQATNNYNGTQTFVSGQQCWRWTVRIPTPAVLVYSGPNDQYPSNFAPFMCLGYIQPDGNAAPDNLLTRVAVMWNSHLDYEDA